MKRDQKQSNKLNTNKLDKFFSNNKKKILVILTIFILVLLIVGISYAAYNYSFVGKESKLESGSVSIKFLESNTNVISLKNSLPEADKVGKREDSFDFAVTTKASYNTGLKYNLSVEKLSVSSGYTSLSDSQVKIYLTDNSNNVLVEPTLISNLSDKLLYTKTNSHSSSKTEIKDMYKLRVWIDQNVDSSSWTKDSKFEYKFKVGLKSEEVIPLGVDTLMSKVGTGGLESITHEADSSLQIGASESITEYRYRGANPSNYVTFNDEVWRIIGVFPTEGSDGVISNRIKLIRNDSIGNAYWDNNDGTTGLSTKDDDYTLDNLIIDEKVSNDNYKNLLGEPGGPFGSNNWKEATLNEYLNSVYYNSLSNYNMIDNVKYYLGGGNEYKLTLTKELLYDCERKISGSDYYYSGNPVNVFGNLALMYASDYGYAASDECTSDLTSYDSESCKNNNWLFFGQEEWILNPNPRDGASPYSIRSYGNVTILNKRNAELLSVRPVLYLKSSIKITGGNGTSGNPYVLS